MPRPLSRLALATALGFAASAQAFTLDPARVFINELHYDDATSTGDVGERIEVVATDGADLSQYQIVLYNGSGGAPYDTDPIPVGTGVNCGASVQIAVLSYATNGIQNGAPDGIALVGPGGQLIQFLSYEGSFTGVGGPANGIASTDIGVAESNATAAGTSLQLRGSGDSYQSMTWAASSADNFGACNTGQTFTAGVDVPPTVASTTPANNATGVAANANVLVRFSEPVATNGTWYGIACTSGARMANVSGGPIEWTLDPTTDFAPGDSCTVNVVAAQVTDLDGTPDAMAADVVFGFSVAPDLPPSVVSTVPANNATNVGLGSNLVVTFSEPVNAGAGAFELQCPPSGPLAVSVSQAAQTTYTIDPAANLEPLANCTLRVVAAQLADLDGNADPLPADVAIAFTTGQGAGDYYAGVDASSCQALRTSLHALIDDHTVYPYTGSPTDVWTMLEAADQDPNDPARLLDVYFNKSFAKVADRDNGTSVPQGTRYNREHTWPQSLGFPDTNGNLGFPNAPRSDAHMLYASEKDWNADRGNKPFADCPPPGCSARYTLAHPITGGAGSAAACNHALGNCNWVGGPDGNQGSFEVWTRRKGDVARAVLYMDIRYEGGVATGGNTQGQAEPELIVTDDRNLIQQASGGTAYMGLKSTLLAWHALDPPDAQEILRNDVVQSFQGNRNPFIDRPDWVAIAFAQPCTGAPPDAVFANGFEP